MIDIHNHILYGIDDGSKSIEESISILKQFYDLGYQEILITPHYMKDAGYIEENQGKLERLQNIKTQLKEQNIPLEIYLGNEIFIEDEILEKINQQKIQTMNGTNYLLIEVPLNQKMPNDLDILEDLIYQGYKVILAHPERYLFFQTNPNLISDYLEKGILLQGNLDSIMGKYGKTAEKLCKYLLKNKMYFCLASDVHHDKAHFFTNFEKIKKKILKITKESYFEELININPKKVLKGEIEK